MTIGDAAKASGVNAKLIRYYESIGLIPEAGRTAAGYRVYSSSDVNVLRFVKRARTLGFSIERIQILVGLWQDRSRSSAEVKRVALDHVAELEAKIAELRAMSDTLTHLAHACHGDERPDCPILRDLEEGGGAGQEHPDRAPQKCHAPPGCRMDEDSSPGCSSG
ncbi:Cu(I)-responsive transcriptional regulator [Azospirillum brasilense]|nr:MULTISPECIES: Cu(I)-responsive transcriptional regulator [Azospirillum]TVZ54258.1 MerR family copper efflux transcriptional regulator [Azospirillum brasilense]TWB79481.1 MerR family copper efflux transcriptional regulator [Azospirillum brasilense]